MSNALSNALTRGLNRLETLSGSQTFRWRNADIPCVPSGLQRGQFIEIGGNPYEIQLSLHTRLNNFLTADDTITVTADSSLVTADNDLPVPLALQRLIFRGQTYLILSATQSGPQSHVVLHLADPASGRK
jgi:hypothetical protein